MAEQQPPAPVTETAATTTPEGANGKKAKGNPVAKVFSGVVPLVTQVVGDTLANEVVGTGGGAFDPLARKLISNVSQTAISVGLSQVLGANLSNQLGVSTGGNTFLGSNILGSIITPDLVQAGVGGLFNTVQNSIANSKALGPFGPIASSVVGSLQSLATDAVTGFLFGKPGQGQGPTSPDGSIYFPGADGEGDGDANFSGGTAYSAGQGGPDVVFSIRYASSAAKDDLLSSLADFRAGSPAIGDIGEGKALPASFWTQEAPSSGANTKEAGAAAVNPAAPVGGTTATTATTATTTAQTGGTTTTPPENQKFGTSDYFTEVGGQIDFGIPSLPGLDPGTVEAGFSTSGFDAGKVFALATPDPPAWKFICSPEDISWETTAQVDRVSIYGANQAPVTAGVKGMRELSMNNSVVEGFTRGKNVEGKIIALEELMNMSLTAENRYVQVPVYRVQAQDKVYGKGINDEGYFIIKSVKVQEKLRDLSGRTTRATVDISFMQVPPYQVSTGRDIASKFLASKVGPFVPLEKALTAQSKQNASQALADAQRRQNTGGGAGSEAPGAATPSPSGGPTAAEPGATGTGTTLPSGRQQP